MVQMRRMQHKPKLSSLLSKRPGKSHGIRPARKPNSQPQSRVKQLRIENKPTHGFDTNAPITQ